MSNERRSFADAPEIRRSLPDPEPMPSPTDLLDAAQAAASQQSARAEAAEAELAEVYETLLDDAAYSDFDSLADPAAVADHLLAAGGGPRLESFVEEWTLGSPSEAAAWTADRQALVAQAAVQQTRAELANDQAAELNERAQIAEAFTTRYENDPASTFLVESSSQIPTADLVDGLEIAYAGLQHADQASRRADAVQAVRDSFRDPASAGIRALDPKTGERRPSVPEATEADVAQRIDFETPAMREARREQELSDFRSAFADAARPRFGPGSQPR